MVWWSVLSLPLLVEHKLDGEHDETAEEGQHLRMHRRAERGACAEKARSDRTSSV